MEKTLMSLLSNTTPVVLVANNTLPDNPLVTPLMNKDGTPKTDLNGAELGSIRLEQTNRSINGGSFMNVRRRTAFIAGTMEQLLLLVSSNKLVEGSQFPGKITISESLEPFWKGQDPKMNPQSAEQVGVTVGDKFYPVFMRMTYVEDMNKADKFIRTSEDINEWITTRQTLSGTAQPVVETGAVPTAP